jgi:Ion channel
MRDRLENLRLRSAVLVIVVSTAVIVVGSAALALLLDRRDFTDTGEALWWSLQTVTTVGYGDVVPVTTHGRIIAGVVMLLGIAASSVLTAFVTSALFEAAFAATGGRTSATCSGGSTRSTSGSPPSRAACPTVGAEPAQAQSRTASAGSTSGSRSERSLTRRS